MNDVKIVEDGLRVPISMNNINSHHHRRSIRISGYDYSREGYYFVTICTQERKSLFGEVKDGKMILNNFGKIVETEIENTHRIRSNVIMDIYQIMPNHLHCVAIINDSCRGVMHYAPTNRLHSPSQTIGSIVRGIKSSVTTQIKKFTNITNIIIWQRNYYEHVIRNDIELAAVREYIQNNPLQWELDEDNPKNIK